ncbi:hypothetical protein M5K25_016998 [Dendrobium thyrsiflorum]|uniref:Uncharacterized protein n=1 Tax=Dendrobium thyrsiflorum TaxID=117978 RepID=A0ABD0UL64_DENTH
MDSTFPPLNSSSSAGPSQPSPNLLCLWSNIFASPEPTAPSLPISLMETPEEIVPFNKAFTDVAASEWNLSLVGYSVGKRPYYETLLSTAKRIWKLKCTFQLIALSDGFFLFKFCNEEDYDMVWSKGISKIASKIGIPIAVDSLTAAKTRLTYARVCIQVLVTSTLPDSVPISIEDEVFHLKIHYEWKPSTCSTCNSLAHPSSLCPSNPQNLQVRPPPPRGRSTSRQARGKRTSRPPISVTLPNLSGTSSQVPNQSDKPPSKSSLGPIPPQLDISNNLPSTSVSLPQTLLTSQTTPSVILTSTASTTIIPNLNSPTEDGDGLLAMEASTLPDTISITSQNKFAYLQTGDEPFSELLPPATAPPKPPQNTNSQNTNIAMTKTARGKGSKKPPNPIAKVFNLEESCNNFNCSSPGRIWLKWDPDKIQFMPFFISAQMIAGTIVYGTSKPFLLSIIYASNNQEDRRILWDDIRSISPNGDTPWILMGDFNCCRYPSDKLGGNALHQNQLCEFNNLIFDANLTDLASVGLPYTWYNQRTDNPIHIIIDRMFINDAWMETFPNSHYVIKPPACSDHSPIVLLPGRKTTSHHRFLFKNYWCNSNEFWFLLFSIFSKKTPGHSFIALCSLLKQFKLSIKKNKWASSHLLADHLSLLQRQQDMCLNLLGSGCNLEAPISLFWDHWINGKVVNEVADMLVLHNSFSNNANIVVILNDSGWNLPLGLPDSIQDYIAAIPIVASNEGCLVWNYGLAKSHRSYANFLFKNDSLVTWHLFVWHKHFALRYSSFCWMAIIGGLKTADVLRARVRLLSRYFCNQVERFWQSLSPWVHGRAILELVVECIDEDGDELGMREFAIGASWIKEVATHYV